MTSQKLYGTALVASWMAFGTLVASADSSTLEKAMAFTPRQKDVEYETPKPGELAKCKVEVERKGKLNGWVVLGPSGQVLRKIVDTDGDGNLDQWRYYNQGIEVYRDIDSNHNSKIDQCRWLNLAGTRWGVDLNEDGKIDQWKVLSAAEASREAIRAMTTGDDVALLAVMITAEDLNSLGVAQPLAAKILESAADPAKRAKTIMARSKSFSNQSKWTRFDAQLPSTIPLDDEKANADLQVYESANAIVETQRDKFSAVQIGEMIRIGEVWKLTQVPIPIEGEGITTNGGILMEPLAAIAGGANPPAPSPKVEKLLKELQELEQRIVQPGQTAAQIKPLMARRDALLKEAIDLAETEDEKMILMKQTVDGYALAAQMGTFPQGVDELKAIEANVAKKSPKSPLLPYTTYRLMQAEYSVNLQGAQANKQQQANINAAWLKGLENFVATYPTSADTDDAMLMLGTNEELQGRTKEAMEWYQRLIKEKPKSESVPRALGATKRINLNGQVLSLSGPGLAGGIIDMKSMRDNVVLVVFWASNYEVCEEDIPQLRALYQDNKSKGFEIVGVSLDFSKTDVLPFIQKNKMTWPQIYEPGGMMSSPLSTSFGIISLPTMFLVNKEGKVVSRNASLTEVKTELPGLLK